MKLHVTTPVRAVVAAVLFTAISCYNGMSTQSLSLELVNPLQDRGFSLITSADPRFTSELHKLLSPQAIDKAKSFLPMSAIVVNDTNRYIWGFSVIYTYLDRIAPAGTPWRQIISPSSGFAERSRMLGPGYLYLVTPVSDFLASCDASGKRSLQPYLDEGLDQMIELFKREHLRDRLRLSVDSIIFDDGGLVGPDSGNRQQAISAESQADRELLASIDGLSGDALRKELVEYSNLTATSQYNNYRKGQAMILLKILEVRGESGFQAAVQSRRTQQRFIGSDMVTKETTK